MFLGLIILTALLALRAMTLAYYRTRDLFHPLVITVPMLLSLYVFLPLKLLNNDVLTMFFADGDLIFIGFVNLLGVASFCLGASTARWTKTLQPAEDSGMTPAFRGRILSGALILGGIGFTAYVVGIINVGGFYAAYSQAYSGGWSESGYIRDAVSLCIPAMIFIMISRTNQKLSRFELFACCIFASPFLLQGFLGARRGPTFVVFAAVALSWYMMRRRRPNPRSFIAAGLGLGLLMLFLVSNRGNIHLGSDWNMENSSLEYLEVADPESGTGNEYIYGAGSILHASRSGDNYYWGRRYFAEVFIRPIPRSLWPNKYAAVGLSEIEENAGTGGAGFVSTLGWSGAAGAAPGLIADLWLEFWWMFFVVLYGIGRIYEWAWRSACTRGGFATAVYVLLASLSVFLVFQTIEAVLVRALFMMIPSWLVWRWANASLRNVAYSPEQAGFPVHASSEALTH